MFELIKLAAKVAMPVDPKTELRSFWIGSVGIRRDGVLVSAKNGASYSSTARYHYIPSVHAESRVLRKLGKNGTLFVARVRRDTRQLGMSMPCGGCQIRIKAAAVKEVYFSINENQYGKWIPSTDYYRIFDI